MSSTIYDLPHHPHHHRPQFTLPSPPADFDQLQFSPPPPQQRCWQQSLTDPCRSVHNLHVYEPPRVCCTSPVGSAQRISSDQCCQSWDVACIYPSPPSSGSQSKLYVALPEEADHHHLRPIFPVVIDAGGILDSPPALRTIDSSHIPLSPPPTIPKTTQDLPESNCRQTSLCDERDRPPLPSPESDGGGDLPSSSSELEMDDEAVLTDESDPGGALEPLLSPLSPEWSTKISNLASASDDDSDSLSQPQSLTFGKEQHRDLLSSSPGRFSESSSSPDDDGLGAADDMPEMLDFPLTRAMDEIGNSWHSNGCSDPKNEWSSWMNDHDLPDSSDLEALRLDDQPPCSDDYYITPHPPPSSRSWFSHCPVPHSGRPAPPSTTTLDIPPHAHHTLLPPSTTRTTTTTTHSDSKSFGYTYSPHDAFRMDEDLPGASPFSSSQSLEGVGSSFNNSSTSFCDRFHSSLPTTINTNTTTTTPFGEQFLHRSPSLRTLASLSDFPDDHDMLPASPSPSRRSFSTLPTLEDDDDGNFFRHPSSPNETLLSLPGSETDDELLPPFSSPDIPAAEPFPHTTLFPSHGLMLMDDQIEEYGQRSPSPELFDIDLDIDDDIYPEFEQLCELRKKALSAEREARSLETQMLEQGAAGSRAETRRLRKREKERAKEIGALLRLKLGNDKVAILQEEERKPRKMATSLPRLVAQMVFRRHDANKPLATRQLCSDSLLHGYVPSSLSQSVSSDFF